MQWRQVPIAKRPALMVPRMVPQRKIDKIAARANSVPPHWLRRFVTQLSLEDINCIAYVGARYVLSLCGVTGPGSGQAGSNNSGSSGPEKSKMTKLEHEIKNC